MILAVLLLAATSLVHIFAAVFLWRANQQLHSQLLRVVAKSSAGAPAVVHEVAPTDRRPEQLTEEEKRQAKARRDIWKP